MFCVCVGFISCCIVSCDFFFGIGFTFFGGVMLEKMEWRDYGLNLGEVLRFFYWLINYWIALVCLVGFDVSRKLLFLFFMEEMFIFYDWFQCAFQ